MSGRDEGALGAPRKDEVSWLVADEERTHDAGRRGGDVDDGGDEFPDSRLIDRLRSRATEIARPLLAKGRALKLIQMYRRVKTAMRGDQFIRSGN